MEKYTNIDEYISNFPADVQVLLQKVRQTIHDAAPEATEKISYGIPTFYLHGNLVHFGGFKNHIGFFPASSGVARFKDELEKYATSKGTVQFPLEAPIPFDLITRIVEFRVQENLFKATQKKEVKKKPTATN
jgi:uncharacterized protein YdhG (YjbR/CyaY superfamily)